MSYIILIVIVGLAAAVGTFLFLKNNKNKTTKINNVLSDIKHSGVSGVSGH